MSGRHETLESILSILEKEQVFFRESGGGVTFSGGEPLMFPEFLLQLLDACKQREIHRTVDTTGFTDENTLLHVASNTNLFLYDLKLMDEARHIKYTGVSNQKILNNLKVLADSGAEIIIRMPLIQGINDDLPNIRAMAEFIDGLAGQRKKVEMLPCHGTGSGKRIKLGLEDPEWHFTAPDSARQQQIAGIFAEKGMEIQIL
jgi:pyruvate formate lyase activating enzyme